MTGRRSAEVFERLRGSGFVFRPFSVEGLELVRVSPNAMNTRRELDALLDAPEA